MDLSRYDNLMENPEFALNILKVFGLGGLTFFIGMFVAPAFIQILRTYQAWPASARSKAMSGEEASVLKQIRIDEDIEVPRLGGILVWGTVFLVTAIFWVLAQFFSSDLLEKLNFLSRNQTWIPFSAFIIASGIGLVDDLLFIQNKGDYVAGGLALRKRVLLVSLIGLAVGWWFFVRLELATIFIPFIGDIVIGWLYIPFLIIVMLSAFSGGIIDGVDGLSGGVFATIFAAYMGIALFQNQIDLAAFLSVMIGAILAFLWFNIPPAKFYMGETGILGLTTVLTVVAFLTDAVIVLPLIAIPLVLASGSAILQMFWKRFFGRKLFLVAPLHHHLEAIGWTRAQITMRFWIFGAVCSMLGMVIILIGR